VGSVPKYLGWTQQIVSVEQFPFLGLEFCFAYRTLAPEVSELRKALDPITCGRRGRPSEPSLPGIAGYPAGLIGCPIGGGGGFVTDLQRVGKGGAMKPRALVLLVMVAALLLVSVAPVSAGVEKPLNGKMELTFFGEPCPDDLHIPPVLTWAGTVVIDGTTYGWADFPTAELVVDGKFIYFEEYWTIFTLGEDEDVTAALACDADRVVLGGFNDGWGPPGMTGKAEGTVTGADPAGPFAEVADGSRMFWRGKVLDEEWTEFKATLHIFPSG